LKDRGVDGRIILNWIFQDAELGGRGWINVIKKEDMWRALVVFFPMPPHVLVDFVVLPPKYGRRVTDF